MASLRTFCLCVALFAAVAFSSKRSSHSEAPGITKTPQADNTDFYMFRSYEPGRSDFTTFIMNVHGLQNPYGGPNYFALSDDHYFQIKIDNDGDTKEDISIQFYAGNRLAGDPYTAAFEEGPTDCIIGDPPTSETKHSGLAVPLNDENGNPIAGPVNEQFVSLKFIGPVTAGSPNAGLNWIEWYQMNWVTGNEIDENVVSTPIASDTGVFMFTKPFDYAGEKTFGSPDSYEVYARQYIYDIVIPDCPTAGRVFVGQRKESFNINVGEVFDLVNFVPIEAPVGIDQNDCHNNLRFSNIDSFVVEVPTQCILGTSDVIGAWTVVNHLCHSGDSHVVGSQVSRLGMPLVNELVIPIANKSVFNTAKPSSDGQFLEFVQYPSFPAILDILFRDVVNGALGEDYKNIAPFNFPRDDLVATFLTGLAGINQPPGVTPSEQLRLNTSIPAVAASNQNSLGVIAGDAAGFPNGRRPGDDAVDIVLRVAMGKLCKLGLYCVANQAPVGDLAFTDGAPVDASYFDTRFPYLRTPVSGSPWPGQTCDTATPSSSGVVALSVAAIAAGFMAAFAQFV